MEEGAWQALTDLHVRRMQRRPGWGKEQCHTVSPSLYFPHHTVLVLIKVGDQQQELTELSLTFCLTAPISIIQEPIGGLSSGPSVWGGSLSQCLNWCKTGRKLLSPVRCLIVLASLATLDSAQPLVLGLLPCINNCEGSGILPYLKSNKLTYQNSRMLAEDTKLLVRDKRHLVTQNIITGTGSLRPNSHRAMQWRPDNSRTYSGLCERRVIVKV